MNAGVSYSQSPRPVKKKSILRVRSTDSESSSPRAPTLRQTRSVSFALHDQVLTIVEKKKSNRNASTLTYIRKKVGYLFFFFMVIFYYLRRVKKLRRFISRMLKF